MNAFRNQRCVVWRVGKRGLARGLQHISELGIATLLLSAPVQADNFTAVRYDVATDQLVITMVYRGTNSDHAFSLKWGQCKDMQGENMREVGAEVLDSQWQDVAHDTYKKTTRFDLSNMPCRPAKVTLRTAPRFIYTVVIPASRH